MRSGNALDVFLFAEPVQQSAGAAIGIGDEDAAKPFGARLVDSGLDAGRDFFRSVVPDRRQAYEVDVVEPVCFAYR